MEAKYFPWCYGPYLQLGMVQVEVLASGHAYSCVAVWNKVSSSTDEVSHKAEGA